ncbi:MAG: four-carbon acid sugar kinase family protein [Chloroflexota bacterium]
MFHLAIIADDLTGAMDAGVQFAKRNLRTVVSLSDRLGEHGAEGADVIVLNTNSRPDEPAVAAAKVRECGAHVRDLGVRRAYKKIDSTLRGNVGTELDALMDAWGVDTTVLTPAFPAVGRTMVGGLLMVNGVPWEKTQYAEGRVATSFVPEIIGTRRRTATVELGEIAGGEAAVAERLRGLAADGVGVIVADAMTEQDLEVVARAVVLAGLEAIVCGSGGMAEVLPGAFGLVGRERPSRVAEAAGKPALVIAGTVNRVTIEQVRGAFGATGAACVEVLPQTLRRDPEVQIRRVADACAAALREKRDLIIASVPLWDDAGMSMVARDAAVAASLGPVVAGAVRPGDWAGIVMTGGDTAVSVCAALGAGTLEIEGEVEPGVPYGRLLEGALAGQLVVTKAGGFGSANAITNAITFIKGGNK